MAAPLNFGPSEQTVAQRHTIAQRALELLQAEDEAASVALQDLYGQYIAGEVDLYAISQHVREEVRQKLAELVQAV